jgi:glycosyltransferase involved in cell wall biosynthesis
MRRSTYEVLIYCPLDGGHHLNFARLVSAGFSQLGVRPVLATTEKAEMSRELASAGIPILRLPTNHSGSQMASLGQRVEDLRRLVRERHWSRIVLPAGDGLLQVLGLAAESGVRIFRPGLPVEALALRGSVAYPGARMLPHLKHLASWHFLERAPATVRHHLDPVFMDWLRVQPPPRTEWRLMPDPVEIPAPLDRQTARMRLGIPVDGFVVGCVGVLDERKGVHLVVDAFDTAHLASDVRLLLVGMCTPAVKAAVASLRARPGFAGRVHVCDEWVTDEKMMTAIAAMDLVVAAYPGHVGSASIVLRVMAAGRPVLGSPTPWIARHVSSYGAGWVSHVNDREAFASDLARAVVDALSWRPSPRVRELLAFNSPENFMAHWTRATAAELGCSPAGLESGTSASGTVSACDPG